MKGEILTQRRKDAKKSSSVLWSQSSLLSILINSGTTNRTNLANEFLRDADQNIRTIRLIRGFQNVGWLRTQITTESGLILITPWRLCVSLFVTHKSRVSMELFEPPLVEEFSRSVV